MIEISVALPGPQLKLTLPALEASVPYVRQALRSQGQALGANPAALEDAELATTEACANVVEHAYPSGEGGALEITVRPSATELLVSVLDRGRGMESSRAHSSDAHRGFGLPIITAVTRETAFKDVLDGGTEVEMTFDLGIESSATEDPTLAADTVERVIRRLVAVMAAQLQMPSDRLVEGLLVAELVTRHAFRQLLDGPARLTLDRLERGFELRVGPLGAGGGDAVLMASELPAVGPVIERLSDSVRVEPAGTDAPGDTEQLAVRVLSPDSAQD